eukprot:CAMPEP_0194202452 /NCGR_PEP_ID=MMETSP0156-20130528/2463_1 /TAXON_ID=33649 /ORGANISM="Thalassionema nitzschioides, Strain L26-B" /LENGTH=1220 /DNA_ID=CAMNT_0038927941 /DNA_START=99 /DNA_END=3761 /DNA_ORIENTATION=+
MNGFPPPPGGGGFPPPPGGGFPPPPPAGQQPAAGFPPPPGGGFQAPPPPGGGGFQAPSPPGGGGFQAQPPPQQQPQQYQQFNQGMANMSIGGQQQQPPAPAGQPKPAMFTPPAPGGGFAPPPPPGGGFAQPQQPPANNQPPPPAMSNAGSAGPTMFTPRAPAGGMGMGAPPPPAFQQPAGNAAPPPPQQQPPGMMQTPGMAPQPGMNPPGMGAAPGMSAAPGMGQPFQENIDFSIQVPKRLLRFTTGSIPISAGLQNSSKVPIGGVITPMAIPDNEDDEVDTVQPGNSGIIRCKRCRTYINAFVSWLENGRRWRCNICAQLNECPSAYFCHLDEKGHRRDRDQRPELSKGVVEFIAPAEYMVRPPQEPTYFFVLDVSATAVRSGMLAHAANAIKESLDHLPGRGRTKIGFITYDNSVHYYNLAPDLNAPQMMVVSDLKELFVPLPDHLLVNLKESRSVVESFLDSLPDMFTKNPVVSLSCLGPALKAAFTVMKQIGGKMIVFQSIMPNLGDGALRPRENHAVMGTPQESKILRPGTPWYKDTAVEFSRQQISVDMFLFPYQYLDVSALSELPRYTAGALHSYVGFNPERDGLKFESQLKKRLTQTTAFEAVMRIRCTKGMRITNFYGNFFIRGSDLLALPNCTTDSCFAFDMEHDEQNMPSSVVTVQAALLYTSSEGQRRIRVMTQALPLTQSTKEIIESIDTEALCNVVAKRALDMSLKSSLDNARMRVQHTCVELIRTAKGGRTVSGYSVPPGGNQQTDKPDSDQIPSHLELLPLYTLALMKNVTLRGGTDVHPDERMVSQYALNSMKVTESRDFLYPKLFSIHDMLPSAGLPHDGGDDVPVAGHSRIRLPQAVNLSCERLTNEGIFLLDNGIQMSLWVGSAANPSILQSLFETSSLESIQSLVSTPNDDFGKRFHNIMHALNGEVNVNIVREGDAHLEARFFWHLIEDRASFQGGTYSYEEFMNFCNDPNANSGMAPGPLSAGPPGGMPPPPGQRGMPPPPGQPGMPPPPGQPGMPPPPGQRGMPPPPGQPGPPAGNYSMVPPNYQGPPPHGGPSSGGPPNAMPPPQGPGGPPRSAPPAGPAYSYAGAPSAGGYPSQGPPSGGMPPAPRGGPPSGGMQLPPRGGPPSGGMPPPRGGPPSGGMPPPPGGPPQGGMPPPPGGPPSGGGYGQAPPPGGPPSGGGYGQAPPPGGLPPPQRGGMAPPPPPMQSSHPPPPPRY